MEKLFKFVITCSLDSEMCLVEFYSEFIEVEIEIENECLK